MPDVDILLEGYRTVGHWTLGQICNHLSTLIQESVAGSQVRAPWLVRKTLGPLILRQILKTERIRPGLKLPRYLLPKSDLDDRAEAEALRATLYFFASHMESFAEHPFFGTLTRDQWTQLHRIHCAHHLSFVWPNAGR